MGGQMTAGSSWSPVPGAGYGDVDDGLFEEGGSYVQKEDRGMAEAF